MIPRTGDIPRTSANAFTGAVRLHALGAGGAPAGTSSEPPPATTMAHAIGGRRSVPSRMTLRGTRPAPPRAAREQHRGADHGERRARARRAAHAAGAAAVLASRFVWIGARGAGPAAPSGA